MTYKYGTDAPASVDSRNLGAAFHKAIMANANRGGENVAPGSLIGSLLGASIGFSRLPAVLLDGLAPAHRAAIDAEVDAFLAASPYVQAAKSSL